MNLNFLSYIKPKYAFGADIFSIYYSNIIVARARIRSLQGVRVNIAIIDVIVFLESTFKCCRALLRFLRICKYTKLKLKLQTIYLNFVELLEFKDTVHGCFCNSSAHKLIAQA